MKDATQPQDNLKKRDGQVLKSQCPFLFFLLTKVQQVESTKRTENLVEVNSVITMFFLRERRLFLRHRRFFLRQMPSCVSTMFFRRQCRFFRRRGSFFRREPQKVRLRFFRKNEKAAYLKTIKIIS